MTTIDQIKYLNLTEEDFKLIVDGLDSLPEKGMAGELMGDLLGSMLMKEGDEGREKWQADREKKRASAELAKYKMKEDIKILQGKLLMLKRFLQESGALNEAYEVLQIPRL